ncbi:MAG TPA: hypothetical protein V6D18_16695 [Thermosynechococcaceae cyanobacterium]
MFRLENDNIDIKLAISSLIETVNLHQRNFETSQRNFDAVISEIREMRVDIREMQSEVRGMQTDIRGLQLENRRILDRWLGQQTDEE